MNVFRLPIAQHSRVYFHQASPCSFTLFFRKFSSASSKPSQLGSPRFKMDGHGDLNNTHAARPINRLEVDPTCSHVSLAIAAHEDDADIRHKYRPFLLDDKFASDDWVAGLELSTALKMVQSEILDRKQHRLRILVLYGSLRSRYVSHYCYWQQIRLTGGIT